MTRQFSKDDQVLNTRSLVTSRTRDYSDFNLLFKPRKGDRDLFKVVDAGSVLQSVKNLILTNSYERPFKSNIGGNVSDFLFDLNDSFAAIEIEDSIRRVIENYEPRASVREVRIRSVNQSVEILVEFSIVETDEVVVLNLAVERLR